MISESWAPFYGMILTVVYTILAIGKYFQYAPMNAYGILKGNNTSQPLLFSLAAILIIFLGLRPISLAFGDMLAYSHLLTHVNPSMTDGNDWMFYRLMSIFSSYDPTLYFLFIAACYIGFSYTGLLKLFKNNSAAAFILLISSFSFNSYGLNGIRAGFAASMFLMGMSFFVSTKTKKERIIAIGLCLCSCLFHKSMTLPLICMGASYYIRDYRKAVLFWFFSIILYLMAGNAIGSMFASLGFDDRLNTYIEATAAYAARGLKTGFRLDFLIYSFMPLLLGYYVQIKHGVQNRTYQMILNTYIFANAFWCMLMGVSYSNRFAYLSWFMYPLVLAYPCLKLNVLGQRQGRMAANVILINALFSFFMTFIYY